MKVKPHTSGATDIELVVRRAANYLYVIAVKRGGSPAPRRLLGPAGKRERPAPHEGRGAVRVRAAAVAPAAAAEPGRFRDPSRSPAAASATGSARTTRTSTASTSPDVAAPYPWPVKPFDRQHPVRGFFNDPRVQDASHAFHFGIDVSAPDGTAVYAVTPGRVFIEDKGHAVAVQAPDGRAFGYWHVKPAVAHHQQVRLHQLLGHIEKGWGHVHFAESINRSTSIPSGRAPSDPFVDVGHPTIAKIMFRAAGKDVAARPRQGPPADLLHRLRHDAHPRARAVVAHAGRSRARALPDLLRGQVRPPAARRGRPARVPQARQVPRRSTGPRPARTTPTSPGSTASSSRTTGTARSSRTTTTTSRCRPPTCTATSRPPRSPSGSGN